MKRLISGMLIIAMLFSMNLPIQAAEDSIPTKLNKLGLLSGISEQELRSSLTRDVGITMILKAIGYTQDDADFVASNGYFVDVDGWAQGWAELAYLEGITNGVGSNHFDPRGLMSEKQFVAFLLRALEYDTEAAWSSAVALGYQADVTGSGNSLTATRLAKEDAAVYMYNALSSELQEESRTLINTLIDQDLVSSAEAELQGLIPEEFEITSKVYNNYKEIFLTFSKSINEHTLTSDTFQVYHEGRALSFDLDPFDGTGSSAYAVELINHETLRIYFGTAIQKDDEVKVEIKGLASDAGEIMTRVLELTVKDVLSPKVEKVEAIALDTLRFTLSEPVQISTSRTTHSNILIDDVPAKGKLSLNYDKTEVTLKLAEPLDEDSYRVEADGFEDFNGVLSKVFLRKFDVKEDETMTSLKSAELTDAMHMTLVFDQRINPDEGTVKVGSTTYKVEEQLVKEDKLYIELNSTFKMSTDKTIVAEGIINDAGNKTDSTQVEAKVPVDMKSPTMLVRGIDADELLLIFSEPVKNVDRNHIYVRSDAGNVHTVSSLTKSDNSDAIYHLRMSGSMIGNTSYYVSVKDIKDLTVYENVMPTAEVNIGLSDTKQPTVSAVNILDNGKVRVTYSEAMNGTYIGNTAFYRFYDTSAGTNAGLEELKGVTMVLGSDNKYVDIDIPGLVADDKITVLKVRDKSGNLLSNYGSQYAFKATDVFGASDLTVQLVDNQTVRVTAGNHTFADVKKSDFTFVTEEGKDGYLYAHSATIDSDNSHILNITLNTKMDDDGTYLDSLQYMVVDGTDTVDAYGTTLEVAEGEAIKVVDKVRPVVTVSESGGKIRIEFSEMVKAGGNSEVMSEINLKDSSGNTIDLMPGISLFYVGGEDFSYRGFDELVMDGLDDGNYTLTVNQRYIKDMNGNLNRGYSGSVTVE